jgi:hypothetical protein
VGVFSLFLCGLLAAGCGGGGNRVLQSISISPNPAVTTSGGVQLVATGTYSTSPLTVRPMAVNWYGPAFPEATANPVSCAVGYCPTIDASGMLTCGSHYTGTFTVTASAPVDPKEPLTAQNVPTVSGTTTVSCDK